MDGYWRSISVALTANTSGYSSAMARASTATKGLSRDVKTSERDLAGFGTRAQRFGRDMTVGVTLPIAAAGAAALKFSTDFGRTFQQAQGLAGVAASEVAGLRQEVLDLAGQTGQAPQLLAEGLYEIRSSGLSGQAALDALTASAQAAAAGLGEARTVADAVTSAMNAYGQDTLSAATATDVLIAAVREGKGEPAEMAGQFGRLLPIASELGISFDQVGGGLAFLTRSSGDAAQSSTQLLGVMSKILRPTQQAREQLEGVGLSAEELQAVVERDGLLAALRMLEERFGGNRQAMTLMFDDVEALNGVLSLLRGGGTEAAAVMDSVAESGGSLREAFEGWEQTDIAQAEKALADLQATAIEVGSELAPIVSDIAEGVGDIAGAFRALPDPAQKTLLALAGIAAAAGPISSVAAGVARLTQAFGGFRAFLASSATAGPIMAGAAVGVGVLVNAFISSRREAAEAKAAVDDLAAAADSAGKTTEEVFRGRLARSWAGFDDGLDVDNVEAVVDTLKTFGIAADDVAAGLTGTTADYRRFKQAVDDAALASDEGWDRPKVIGALDEMRRLSRQAAEQQRELDAANADLGTGTDDTAGSIDGASAATERLTASQADAVAMAEEHAAALEAEQDAANKVRDTFLGFGDLVSGLGNIDPDDLSGGLISQWYADQTAKAEEFGQDVNEAIRLGYDPGLISDLLTKGPEQAADILDAIVSDHSDTNLWMVNSSAAALADISEEAAEVARIMHRAMVASTDETSQALDEALAAQRIMAAKGSDLVAQDLIDGMQVGADEVLRILDDYGIGVSASVNQVLEALGKQPIRYERYRELGAASPGFNNAGLNAGGPVPGPNVDRDVVPAMLTPGEFVIRKSMVDKYGVGMMAALNEGRWGAYATGGRVTGDTVGLHPAHMAGLQAWSAMLGRGYHVRSGYRSRAEQERLYAAYLAGTGNLAAVPGSSMHEYGLATDGPHWGAYARGSGFHFPVPGEPWHAELLQARALRGQGVSTHGIIPPEIPTPPSVGGWPLAQGVEGAMARQRQAVLEYLGGLNMGATVPNVGGGGVKAIAQQLLAARGWAGYWPQLDALITRESGWNPNAQNPTSSAYGLAQFLDSTWATVGGSKTSDPALQLEYLMRYIGGSYGNPAGAWDFWQKHHWYNSGGPVTVHGRSFDSGGTFAPGWNMAYNATGKPEPLRPVTPPPRPVVLQPIVYIGNERFDSHIDTRADVRIEHSAEVDDRLARQGSRNA